MPTPETPPYVHPVDVRYMEVDQQGVVFNSWYLVYFDDALVGFLAARGLPYETMMDAGFDVMLVRSEIDWRAGVGWRDAVEIVVSPARLGTTSFTLDFDVRRNGDPAVFGRTVYVVVATDGSGTRPIPALLGDALGQPAPLRPL